MYGCSKFSQLILDETIETIGTYSFAECKGITGAISFPAKTTTIYSNAFANCSGITSITNWGSISSIGENAFSSTSIEKLELPGNVTSISKNAFSQISSLKSVKYLGSKNPASENVFTNSGSGLTKAEVLIGYEEQYFCELIAETNDECGENKDDCLFTYNHKTKALTFSGKGLMKNYTQETKAPWYPKVGSILSITTGPLQTIGSYAFSQCKAITSITIPKTVTRINTKAFEGCSEVTSLKYPRSEITTTNDIFEGCSKLTLGGEN